MLEEDFVTKMTKLSNLFAKVYNYAYNYAYNTLRPCLDREK